LDQAVEVNSPANRIDYRSLTSCLVGNFFLRAAAGAAGTLIALYLAGLTQTGVAVGAGLVSLTAMLFYLAELAGSPVFGYLSDLRGRKTFMLLGPVFGGVAVQFIYLAPTISLVLLARVLQGVSTAASVPSALSYVSSTSGGTEKSRGRILSAFEVATIIGMAAGLKIGGSLWDLLGHTAFLAVFGMYVVSFALLWIVKDDHQVVARARSTLGDRLAFVRSGAALRLVPAWIAVNAIVGLWFTHLAFQMGKRHDPNGPAQLLVGGYSGSDIGSYTAGFALLFVVGIGLWSLSFGRLRSTQVMGLALVGLFALVVTMFFLNHSLPHDPTRIRILLGLIALFVVVLSGFTPAALVKLAGIAEQHPEGRGSMMGLYSVFLGVGQFIGGGLGGPFADWRGVDGMIILTGLLGGVAAVFVVGLARQDSLPGVDTPSEAQRPSLGLH
jgi:MFS family permease